MPLTPEFLIHWLILLTFAAAAVVWLYRWVRRLLRVPDASEQRAAATSWNVKAWAQKYGLRYFNIANQLRQAARMEQNPGKDFFRADEVMNMSHDGPYVEGEVRGRTVWLYLTVGRPRFGSLHAINERNALTSDPASTRVAGLRPLESDILESSVPAERQQVMYAWCLEISTHPMPHRLRITRQSMREADEVDTEWRDFEKRYDVNNFEDSLALQLLDPQMMQLILDSRVDAIEFSDSSFVMYELNKHTTAEVLDTLLEVGLKIAEQVDKNYPLGKYAKEAK
jgi:hypothetical protein